MIEAVIFDMDGVIIDSEPIHYKVNQELFKKLEIFVPNDEYKGFIGISNSTMWALIRDKYKLKPSTEELKIMHFNMIIENLKSCNKKPIPGILNLLKELKQNNIPIGLASSSERECIKLVLRILDIKEYFNTFVSGEEVTNGKPAPDVFLRTAELLKVNPINCIVIEDSKNGTIAAKTAGMKCIGFQNKNSGNQDLSQADLIADSIEELNMNILNKLYL